MDLFRSPGIGPASLPRLPSPSAPTFGPASTRRYGRYRSVRPVVSMPPPRSTPAADAHETAPIDQDFEEYFFE